MLRPPGVAAGLRTLVLCDMPLVNPRVSDLQLCSSVGPMLCHRPHPWGGPEFCVWCKLVSLFVNDSVFELNTPQRALFA
jgi:hypothetical protein